MPETRLDEGSTTDRLKRGMRYPWRGMSFLWHHPELVGWAVIPAIAQLLLLTCAAWFSFVTMPAWLATFWNPTAVPMVHIYRALVYTAALALLVALGVLVYLVSGLIGAPFYDRLSNAVEELELGPRADDPGWETAIADIGWSIWHSCLAVGLWVVCQLLFTLLNALPFGTFLDLGSGITVSSLFLARELMDGSLSRRRMSFRHKLRLIRSQPALIGGFGVAAGAVLWVPILNTVTMPACVIAATLLTCDLERQELIPGARDGQPFQALPRRSGSARPAGDLRGCEPGAPARGD